MTLMQQLAKKTRERRPDPRPYTGPDKASANGNRPLTFPTPYHGGKRRWAEQILEAFGTERECVYVEPFSGSAAVLLANPRPFAREILCDTNPHISNVFRCLAWAPEATAFWADWPTTHQDLTARHTWLLRWAVDHVADIEADPDFHDPKAAGWWLWGKSNWIGTEFAIVRGLQVGGEPDMADATRISTSRPHTGIGHGMGTGVGVQVGRDQLPVQAPDKRPLIEPKMGGQGVQASRYDAGLPTAPPDKIPHIAQNGGGIGITAQREGIADDGPPDATHGARGAIGRARQARQAAPEKIPHVKEITAGRGVSAQRHGDILYGGGKGYQPPPTPPDSRPMIEPKMGGRGVQASRYDDSLPRVPDGMPHVGLGRGGPTAQGVQVQRTTIPQSPADVPYMPEHGGGRGVNAQRKQSRPDSGGRDAGQPTAPDWIPGVSSTSGQGGVSAQSAPPDKRPAVYHQWGGGSGVSAQRDDDGLPTAPDIRPLILGKGASSGTGVQACRETLPTAPRPTGPVPLTGDRLRPWFQALAERLYRVIILNRGWQSGLTPTVLQQTRTARKPPVRVLLDPPYKGVGKLYGMSEDDADALAVASWRWAAENGSREGWRIAYACREGDFDDEALALGWTCSKTGIAANHSDSTQEVIWFSPHCLRPGQPRRPAPGEQGRMFETGE